MKILVRLITPLMLSFAFMMSSCSAVQENKTSDNGGNANSGLWTWIAGSSGVNKYGTYGIQGVADPANIPGGRNNGGIWQDGAGNVWLFGGYGFAGSGDKGYLNDLWKYDIAAGNWTWMSGTNVTNYKGIYGIKGTAANTNYPGGRTASAVWTDSSGNVWIFGGYGFASSGDSGYLNDLWKYDGSNWTWVSGTNVRNQHGIYGTRGTAHSTNVPGARESCVSWRDNAGNLWIFGGFGYDGAGTVYYLNDLWKFDGSNWTWVSGTNIANQPGTYGIRGTAADTNVPGSRTGAIGWKDSSGTLLLFGGYGYDSLGADGALNDLWKYDTATGMWTWVSGTNVTNQSGIYGIKGTASASNIPGARYRSPYHTDTNGNLWLWGGIGFGNAGAYGTLGDLWKYDIMTGNWTWVSGTDITNQAASYGTMGTPTATDNPGCRQRSMIWTDSSGNFWFFGGLTYGIGDQFKNDLWKFQP